MESYAYSFANLTYSLGEKQILKDLSGIIRGGVLTVIMGSSGAGKTTFIDLLAGRHKKGKMSGELSLNGQAPREIFRSIGGYVLQQDLLMANLTVTETLMFYANLHLDADRAAKTARVEELIETLGLTECAQTFIGNEKARGVSGGEMKRVSIAVSLITNPQVLILDEPTSGLDSHNALIVMEVLKKLTETGVTVICTLHQPSIEMFAKIDDLLLLHHGELCYLGEKWRCRRYFKNRGLKCPRDVNMATFLISALLDEKNELAKAWRKHGSVPVRETPLEARSEVSGKFRVNFLLQLFYLLGRDVLNLLRDPRILYGGLVQSLFTGLIAGSIYFRLGETYEDIDARFGVMFFVAMNQGYQGMVYLTKYMEERDVFKRERAAGSYTVLPYFLSKTITESPFLIVYPTLASTIAYWMCNLNEGFTNYLIFLAAIILNSICGLSLFTLIGAIAPNPTVALAIAPLLVIVLFVLGGFFIHLRNIPVYYKWLSYVSFYRYTVVIITQNEFSGRFYECTLNETVCQSYNLTQNGTSYYPGDAELEIISDSSVPVGGCFAILFGMILVYRLLTYLVIVSFHKQK